MLRYLIIVYLLCLCACASNQHPSAYLLPNKTEVQSVIKAVLVNDSAAIGDLPVALDLRKIEIDTNDTDKQMNSAAPPSLQNGLSPALLMNDKRANKKYFNRSDSGYIVFQSKALNSFQIDRSILKHGITRKEEDGPDPAGGRHSFYQLSIPIFSLDKTTAYVEVDKHCPDCGGGHAVYLEKANGKWAVACQYPLWRN